ncbi:MAG: murein biosynthesis integral membrane protein MurJ [Thermodesulfobacteriota bacterium]
MKDIRVIRCQSFFIRTMSENHKITKAATLIGIGTLLSRISGFLRDMVVAYFFGAAMATDAFFVAFRIPNLWRRLVGEGSMTVSFIPVYTEYLTQRTEKESQEVTHIAFTVAGLLLLVLTALGIIFSPILVKVFALTWSPTSEKFQLAVILNRIMFPYLFFIGLFALCMGILNSLRHFFAPAFATVFLNLSIIVSVFLFYYHFQRPVMALAIGVLAGGMLQFFFQIPFLIRKKIDFRFNFNFRHPAIRRIGLLMIPGLIGTAVYQLNVLIDTMFATALPEGSVSYLYYADRLMEFPLGIFVIAIGTAALPSFSSLVAQGKTEEFKETVSFAFRLGSFICIPAMVGLISLKTPILNLLLQRGEFDYFATKMTAKALLCYSFGLWAIGGVRVLAPAFYSLQDTKTPLKIGLVCLGANVVLICIFIYPLQHAGLALATSLSSILNLFLLYRKLNHRLGGLDMAKNIRSLLKTLLCGLIMGWVAYLICSVGDWTVSGNTIKKIFLLGTGMVGGLGVYLASSYWMKNQEMIFLLNIVKRKLKR